MDHIKKKEVKEMKNKWFVVITLKSGAQIKGVVETNEEANTPLSAYEEIMDSDLAVLDVNTYNNRGWGHTFVNLLDAPAIRIARYVEDETDADE